jgi:hypothetical protein
MLETIYEEQLYKSPQQELQEHHKAVLGAFSHLRNQLLKTKLWYQRQKNHFYETELGKLEHFDEMFEDLREDYLRRFINHPFTNHPNPETRKDLV